MKTRKVTGLEFRLVQLLMFLNIWWVGVRLYKSPLKALKGLKELRTHGDKVLLGRSLSKAFRHEKKYGWDMFHPLWPSPAFDKFFYHHMEEVMPSGQNQGVLRRLLVAITKKCPLQCAHCSEWDTLNQKDVLSREELREKIQAMVDYGVSQIVYSGGEPLNRFDDLVWLIDQFRDSSNWVYTSGYGLTVEKAKRLKEAGCEGIAISLDHHDPDAHNAFRGSNKSFDWVKKAVLHCHEQGLLVSVNVCPTREYLAEGAMPNFVELMEEWQVPMVNVLEPRAVGHFANMDVELRLHEKNYLEELFYQYNFEEGWEEKPIFLYPAISRKHLRCGGGISYLLLDYDGTLRPCPFCKAPMKLNTEQKILCEA
ncbi:MAG: radical SAM protein [Bacteroidota bacterium]